MIKYTKSIWALAFSQVRNEDKDEYITKSVYDKKEGKVMQKHYPSLAVIDRAIKIRKAMDRLRYKGKIKYVYDKKGSRILLKTEKERKHRYYIETGKKIV